MQNGIPRIYQPTRRERFAYFWKQYAAFVVAGLLALALSAGALTLSLKRTLAMQKDTTGCPMLSGEAIVSQVLSGRGSSPSLLGPYTVELNFQGQSVWTHAAIPFYIGQRVILHYQIGRSGSLYPISVIP